MVVAKRNRYRHMEIIMTRVILGFTLSFLLFLLFSWRDITIAKYIFGSIATIGSALTLGWLYLIGEFKHRRSLWMITALFALIVCCLVSLVFRWPCPPVVPAAAAVGAV